MPSIYDLKPKFQAFLRPLAEDLVVAGATANQVTFAALVISILLGIFLAGMAPVRWVLIFVPIWLFIRMALNAIDGMMAREHNMKSNLGALLNELGDVLADAALYLPLALWLPGWSRVLLVIVVLLGVISEMAGVCAVQIGADRRYDGPMGKSDRAFWLGLLALLLMFGLQAGAFTSLYLFVIAALLVATILNRGKRALHNAPSARE